MARNGASLSSPEAQSALDLLKRRQQLAPFWDDAEKDALKKLAPPPQAPRPQNFGLTEAEAQRIPLTSPPPSLITYIILTGIWLLAFFRIIEFMTSHGSHEVSGAGLGFILIMTLLIAYGWLPQYIDKYLHWVQIAWWDRRHPNWRLYFDDKINFETEQKEYNKKKHELTKANAERRHSIALRKEEYWRKLSGIEFETELANLYKRMGYTVEKTPYTNDGGVDLILRKNDRVTVVQCKAHQTRISISTARELYASMIDFNADAAIIACFEGVTKPVEEYAKSRSISILHVNDIVLLHERHGIR